MVLLLIQGKLGEEGSGAEGNKEFCFRYVKLKVPIINQTGEEE